MDAEACDLIAGAIRDGLLGRGEGNDSLSFENYWSGDVAVPTPVERDFEAYLLRADVGALARVALWAARRFYLSERHPRVHIRLVRWLFVRGEVTDAEAVDLLSFEGGFALLDEAGQFIVLVAREVRDERRPEDWQRIALPLLMDY